MMTRSNAGRAIGAITAVTYLAAAGAHTSAYASVTSRAADSPADIRALVSLLWLAFACDLVVIGLIVAALAFRPSHAGRLGMAMAALCPLAAAGLQVRFLGFIAPTALLLFIAVLTVVSATVMVVESDAAAP